MINNTYDISNLSQLQLQQSPTKFKTKNYHDIKFSNNLVDCNTVAKNLTKDLIDFHEYNRTQIRKNSPIVERILDNVTYYIKNCCSDLEVLVFGSYSTNLCLAWSDIDLVLVNRNTGSTFNPNVLRDLKKIMESGKWVKSISLIETTNIPVLKIVTQDNLLNYYIDVSVQDSKHFGLKCVELVKLFLDTYETLEPLIIGLKNLLKCAALNDPYKGGLSSYGLILLVVFYLQMLEDEGRVNPKDKNNVGQILLEFLFYYGARFEPTKTIIETYIPGRERMKYFQVS
jgi:non-canonical poly(A) RNA polymerase PAPD5/7